MLDGGDLSQTLKRGPLSPAETHGIFVQLCHALGAAHLGGIVHRDLKPENVFLVASRRADAPYTVKVLDFGIAKVIAEAQAVNTGASGTPLYMAPEQTQAGRVISPRTDVWALGPIAFRMLAGRACWKGASSEDVTPLMVLRETLMNPLVPASERAAELGAE
ncbi:MAG: protein kinase, partial [Deltaproteobacteria bacterium]|nr:protein kinase [Deltaproteobacteria bacterium]